MVQSLFSTNAKDIGTRYFIFAIFLAITILQNPTSEFLLCFFPGIFYYKELNCSESSLIIKANESKQLNPLFVTGFVDAEGCFSIIFQKRQNFNLGWQSCYIKIIMVRFLFSIIIGLFLTYSLFLTISISSLIFLLIDEIILLWNSTDSNEFLILSVIPAFTFPLESNSKEGLNPNFVTGFTDAEGCFMIRIIKDKRQKLGWVVKPMYKISLHSKDIQILYKLQKFFKAIGTIDTRTNRDVSEYIVQDINSITNVIIPHFDQFPLESAKKIDYQLWKECVLLIANKEHLTQEGLEKIVSIKGAINLGLSDQLKLAFSNIICMERPAYIVREGLLNPHWISGFSSGDSSFTFSIGANSVKATYEINLHKREMPLLLKIKEFFNSKGNIYNYQTKNSAMFKLTGNLDHNSLVIPHFDKFPLSGLKLHNYIIWKKMVILITNKLHLTEEGLAQLKHLKSTLNKY